MNAFGGVTLYARALTTGLWQEDAGRTTCDDIVVARRSMYIGGSAQRSLWSTRSRSRNGGQVAGIPQALIHPRKIYIARYQLYRPAALARPETGVKLLLRPAARRVNSLARLQYPAACAPIRGCAG